MSSFTKRSATGLVFAVATVPAWSAVFAQQETTSGMSSITVVGEVPSDLTGLKEGPEVEGFISARSGDAIQITAAGGVATQVLISSSTDIKATGGFLGLDRVRLDADSLLNGLPVTVKTVKWGNYLVASDVRFKNSNLATANMIRSGTDQRFGEHEEAIANNAKATEALRGRVADIDQYNILGTTNVYFDTGEWSLSPQAGSELCKVAAQADATDSNATCSGLRRCSRRRRLQPDAQRAAGRPGDQLPAAKVRLGPLSHADPDRHVRSGPGG